MSQDQEEELNFHELVGSLLAASVEDGEVSDLEEKSKEVSGSEQADKGNDDGHRMKIPDLPETTHFGDDDLAAVVAQAIGRMEHDAEGGEPDGDGDQLAGNHNEEEHWAKILQQEILQADQDANDSYDAHSQQMLGLEADEREHLDHDDEQLRRAILESLQQLNEREAKPSHDKNGNQEKAKSKPKSKPKSYISTSETTSSEKSKKDKKSSKKKSSQKERKHDKKKAKGDRHTSSNDDVLNFEDVIKGFMNQTDASSLSPSLSHQIGDAETQALVDATLKAFENELMGTTASTSATKKSSSAGSSNTASKRKGITEKSSKSKSKHLTSSSAAAPMLLPPLRKLQSSKRKKKGKTSAEKKKDAVKKKATKSSSTYDEEVFSKALAEMVNQVVNTSFNETQAPARPTSHSSRSSADMSPLGPSAGSSSDTTQPSSSSKLITQEGITHSSINIGTGGSVDESFDLNQIMQNAMAMAFQEQVQDQLDPSVIEEFNKELSSMQLPEGLTSTKKKPALTLSEKSKKSMADATVTEVGAIKSAATIIPATATTAKKSKTGNLKSVISVSNQPKPLSSLEELYRKRFLKVAKECASQARKRNSQRNKDSKEQIKLIRQKQLDEKKKLKDERRKRQEAESKQLEEIVAKGPPYPAALKLTKTGKPKKPYRLLTAEELAKAASTVSQDANLSKVRKLRKKKERKERKEMLKRIPLSALKKIPLFNFSKNPNASALNDIEGSLAKVPLLGKLESPSELSSLIASRTVFVGFDPHRKTVVHREKVLFHPPWVIPPHPPYALPIAKRRKKTSDRRANSRVLKKKRSKAKKVATLNIGNRIIPAALFPIINTLKAAARATAAAGATPEESRQHLGSMLQQARVTIAQALAIAKSRSTKNYAAIRTTEDIEKMQADDNKAKRIPLLSMKAVAAPKKKVDGAVNANITKSEDVDTAVLVTTEPGHSRPMIIDIEDETRKTPNPSSDTMDSAGTNQASDVVRASTPAPASTLAPAPASALAPAPKRIKLEPGTSIPESIDADLGATTTSNPQFQDIVNRLVQQQLRNTHGENAALPSNLTSIISNTISTLLPELDQLKNLDDFVTTATSAAVAGMDMEMVDSSLDDDEHDENEDSDVARTTKRIYRKTAPRFKSVLNLDGVTPLTHNILKKEEDNTNAQEMMMMRTQSQPSNQSAQRIITTKSINSSKLSRIEEKKPSYILGNPTIAAPSGGVVLSTALKKPTVHAAKTHQFHIPTKDSNGNPLKMIPLMRRVKSFLNTTELALLRKEINKERKRKWREANVERNRDNDLRSRLNQRANVLFGKGDSMEKRKWIDEQYKERIIKLEGGSSMMIPPPPPSSSSSSSLQGIVHGQKENQTSVSEQEILNLIAIRLNKLTTAREIETEIQNEAKGIFPRKGTKSKASPIPLESPNSNRDTTAVAVSNDSITLMPVTDAALIDPELSSGRGNLGGGNKRSRETNDQQGSAPSPLKTSTRHIIGTHAR
ncbi:Spp41p Ecym_1403 [Eremothecium cymbalariae DBVPG|uniref:DUF3020 domain-containing protein n=1 Tax=Eremothecium cymbalariae (strain CBS 270.75 / DBVPG 7215 / KCTC 17166 / NRRL Y-17582) TaxID=931890 RepID=G8JM61_ERECY|nr:hypothetical protein Ecym_1403 [Eremothecium cymbalariae DBVPG\